MYLTYDEYRERGGTLDEPEFITLCIKAATLIDSHTFGRLKGTEPSKVVKALIFELISTYFKENSNNIQSQSNDGYSVTYKTDTDYSAKRSNIIREYLSTEKTPDGTPLLYCGVS